jgi:hypothetical protein
LRESVGALVKLAIGELLAVADKRDSIGRAFDLLLEELVETAV